MRRKAVAAEGTGSSSDTEEDALYGDSSGFLVRMVSRILLGSSNGLLTRLLRSNRGIAPPRPPAHLLTTPALTTQPSLLSGFALALHHHNNDDKYTTADEENEKEQEGEGLAMSADEFNALLNRVQGDMRRTLLLERHVELGEALGRLEDERRKAVERLARVDGRIARIAKEQHMVDRQLAQFDAEDEEEEEEVQGEQVAEVEDVSSEGSADAWEPEDQPRLRLERTLCGHYGAITALAHDPVLGLVASGSVDTHVRVWDTKCLYTIAGHTDTVRAVQFYDRFLLTASNDSRVRMWDLALLDSVQPQASDRHMLPQYFPANRSKGEEVGRWELTEQSTTPPVTPTICRALAPLELCCETAFVGHSDAVTCMQTEGGLLVTGSADRTVREWDVATGAVRQTIDLAWSARSSHTIDRLDMPRGTQLGDGGHIGALQVCGPALATGTADGALRLWDLRTAQRHRQMFAHTAPITSLQFDEQTVVTGSLDGLAVVWDLRMGTVRQKVRFERPVTCVQLGTAQPA
ncbi:Mitochondrial fission protein, partial [Coemansia sp. RSA 2603]